MTVSKNFKRVSKELSWIVNSAMYMSKVRQLVFEQPQGQYSARVPLHVIMHAPIGNAKSTILEQIASQINQDVLLTVTVPGLIGTIDSRTSQLIPGATWTARNNLLCVDEFNFNKKNSPWETMLQLMEGQQKFSRRFGVFSASQNIKDGDLYIKMENGSLSMRTRFGSIFGTMKRFEYMRGQNFRALCSRTVPYSFELEEEDMNRIAEGHKLVIIKPVKIKTKEVVIPQQKYMRIKKIVNECLRKNCGIPTIRKELMLRAIGDCCRIYVATGKNDKRWINEVVRWKIQSQSLIGKYYRKKMDQ